VVEPARRDENAVEQQSCRQDLAVDAVRVRGVGLREPRQAAAHTDVDAGHVLRKRAVADIELVGIGGRGAGAINADV
jgi:hypothetical protein